MCLCTLNATFLLLAQNAGRQALLRSFLPSCCCLQIYSSFDAYAEKVSCLLRFAFRSFVRSFVSLLALAETFAHFALRVRAYVYFFLVPHLLITNEEKMVMINLLRLFIYLRTCFGNDQRQFLFLSYFS